MPPGRVGEASHPEGEAECRQAPGHGAHLEEPWVSVEVHQRAERSSSLCGVMVLVCTGGEIDPFPYTELATVGNLIARV